MPEDKIAAETRTCPSCSASLVNVGSFWICPQHGQIRDIGERRPLRVFLSYGHDRNEELVLQIKADLEARGHHVWFDQTEIKGGDDWRRSITDGIVGSDRVFSFLSEHSARVPGVCLDELAIAIGAKGGNIQTILVEGERDVRPPASVSHIQWLDMHDWKERRQAGGDAWNDWYKSKLTEILSVLESEQSQRFAGEIERLRDLLAPVTSDSRIAKLLSKGFIGRQWLLDAVEAWRQRQDRTSRLLCILGAPGVGKSAFAAHLAHFGRDKVIAVQFCEYDKPDHWDPARIVKTLAFQLAARLPDYRTLLLTLPEIKQLDCKTAPELFEYLLAEPLRQVIDGGRERYICVIDALDEASEGGRNALVEMLAANAQRLPGWLGILATARPESDVSGPLQGLSPLTLDASTTANCTDIREYVSNRLAAKLEGRSDADRLLDLILTRSEGLFLYAEHFCEGVWLDNVSLEDPDTFPVGLGGVYYQYLQRQFPDIEAYRRDIRPVLRAILAAREPMPLEVLRRLFDWSEESSWDVIRDLGSLFVVGHESVRSGMVAEERIRPNHRSFAEFLANPVKSGPYLVSEPEGHRLLSAHGLRAFDRNGALPPYFDDHLVAHLAAAGELAILNRLLGDARFLAGISGRSAVDDVARIALEATSTDEVTGVLRVPERFIEMCRELQGVTHIGRVGGLLPPAESISCCIRPGSGKELWDAASYVEHVRNLLRWYVRGLAVAAQFTAGDLWSTDRLMSVLDSSTDLDAMADQIYEREYFTEPGLAILAHLAKQRRAECIKLVSLKKTIRETDPRFHRFLKIKSENVDAWQELSILKNSMRDRPRWHPKPAVPERFLGAQEDYTEVWRFPCCGRTIVVGDGPPSQHVADGCQEVPDASTSDS